MAGQSASDWYAANFGTPAPASAQGAQSVSVAPGSAQASWGGNSPGSYAGETPVYGSNLATGIAQSNGVNPASLPRQQGGGVSAPDMSAAISRAQAQSSPPPTQPPTQPPDPWETLAKNLQTTLSNLSQSQQAYMNAYQNPTPVTQSQTPQSIVSQITGQPSLVNVSNTPITRAPAPGAPTSIGIGGYNRAGTALPTLPSVDSMYSLYKQINGGRDDKGIYQYLSSPEFQGILQSGQIPMWQSADPTWRLFYARLGMLSPSGGGY